MAQRYETAALPLPEQHEFWVDVIRAHLRVKLDIRPLDSRSVDRQPRFDGLLDVRCAGALQLLGIASEPADAVREPWHMSSADPEVVVVYQSLRGLSHIEQDGRIASLAPGDLTLVDLARPSRLHFSTQIQNLTFALPRDLLAARLGTRTLPTAMRIDGQHGVGALAGSFLRTLQDQAETLDMGSAAVVAEHAMVLMSLALGRAGSQPSKGEGAGEGEPQLAQLGRLRQIRAYIDAHLADPELSPERVAAANRVSLRYLYKLFADTDCSVREWIRERRLARCAEALADPALAERSVGELAFAWGFADQSHFSRVFKRRFDMSPGEYRRRAALGALHAHVPDAA